MKKVIWTSRPAGRSVPRLLCRCSGVSVKRLRLFLPLCCWGLFSVKCQNQSSIDVLTLWFECLVPIVAAALFTECVFAVNSISGSVWFLLLLIVFSTLISTYNYNPEGPRWLPSISMKLASQKFFISTVNRPGAKNDLPFVVVFPTVLNYFFVSSSLQYNPLYSDSTRRVTQRLPKCCTLCSSVGKTVFGLFTLGLFIAVPQVATGEEKSELRNNGSLIIQSF